MNIQRIAVLYTKKIPTMISNDIVEFIYIKADLFSIYKYAALFFSGMIIADDGVDNESIEYIAAKVRFITDNNYV